MFMHDGLIHVAGRVSPILMCTLVVVVVPAIITQAADQEQAEQTVSQQQRADIEAAKTVDDLVTLGKRYVIKREYAAARQCVEKICRLDPQMLKSTKRQSPTSWNDFWFSHISLLREQKLKKDDTAGRIELALWLHEAKMNKQARQMLAAVLEIDNKLPKARELAEQWNLYGGGPVRFDFNYGLNEPLHMESYTDGDTEIRLRKGGRLLLLPFAYNPGNERLTINSSYLKVVTDEGKTCSVKGILLLEDKSSGGTQKVQRKRTVFPELKLQDQSKPLLRRIMITPKEEEEGEGKEGEGVRYELKCYSARRIPRDKSRDRLTDRPDEPTEGSGYAAFLVEVPLEMEIKHLDCEYRGLSSMRLGIDLLDMLTVKVDELSMQDLDSLVEALSIKSKEKHGSVASAAVGKLAQIRSGVGKQSRSGNQSAVLGPTAMKIDQAMFAAMGHTDSWTRKCAFEVLVCNDQPLPGTALQMMRSSMDENNMLSMLDEAEILIADAAEEEADGGRDQFRRGQLFTERSEALENAVEALKPSKVFDNVYVILAACMNSDHEAVRNRALDLVLNDGSRQAIITLADVTRPAQEAVASQLAEVEDDELKAAILRILIARTDDATLSKLLDACDQAVITIEREDDPLLTALAGHRQGEVIRKLLNLLSRAEMSEVTDSNSLGNILKTLSQERQKDAAVWSALLDLALKQFDLPYEAPISGGTVSATSDRRRPSGRTEMGGSGFESLLADVVAGPKREKETARIAAEALVKAGRLSLLKERLKSSAPVKRCLELVQHLSKNKQLRDREALPIFLASCLTTNDVQTIRAILSSLAVIYKETDPTKCWRVNLAIKQGIDSKRLVGLSLHNNEEIAQQATDLLIRLAVMTGEQADEFKSIPGENSREQMLKAMDKAHTDKPGGKFACVVYVDIKADEGMLKQTSSSSDRKKSTGTGLFGHMSAWKTGSSVSSEGQKAQSSSKLRLYSSRRSIPLVASPVKSPVVLHSSDSGGTRLLVNGRNIADPVKDVGKSGRRSTGIIKIDPATLLRAALMSPDARNEGLAGMVDLLSLSKGLQCDLRYEQLGTWSGEVSLSRTGFSPGSERTFYKVTRAIIVLHPVGS